VDRTLPLHGWICAFFPLGNGRWINRLHASSGLLPGDGARARGWRRGSGAVRGEYTRKAGQVKADLGRASVDVGRVSVDNAILMARRASVDREMIPRLN